MRIVADMQMRTALIEVVDSSPELASAYIIHVRLGVDMDKQDGFACLKIIYDAKATPFAAACRPIRHAYLVYRQAVSANEIAADVLVLHFRL